MDLPELLFGLALIVALVSGLWWALPVVVLGYAVMRGAEDAGGAIVDAAPAGDGCALLSGGVVVVGAGLGVLALVLAAGGAI